MERVDQLALKSIAMNDQISGEFRQHIIVTGRNIFEIVTHFFLNVEALKIQILNKLKTLA